jgi:cobaltochelatase CobS
MSYDFASAAGRELERLYAAGDYAAVEKLSKQAAAVNAMFNAPITETKTGEPVTVELKPMTELPAPTPGVIDEDQIASLFQRFTRPMLQKAMDTLYDDMDRKGRDLIKQMRQETAGNKVVAAIQINNEEIRKLKSEAHPQLIQALIYVKSGLHPLLVGPSGCGKTFLAEQLAEQLKLEYGHLTFNAGVSETWLYGRQLPNGFVEGTFARLFREGGVFLCDELDAADSNLLLTLNTALSNKYMFNPMNGQIIQQHKDFHCVGAANTFGKGGDAQYTARNRLDATSLDRFTPLMVDYDAKVEKVLCPTDEPRELLQRVRGKLKERGSKEIISYRAFEKAYRLQKLGGYDTKQIMKILTASWPDNLAREVGAIVK